jgi:hypothetical protein
MARHRSYRSVALEAMAPQTEGNAEPAPSSVKREKLFTWKLVPQPGRGDKIWRASPYRGLVVARAGDPIEARELAAERFSADIPPGGHRKPLAPAPSGRSRADGQLAVRSRRATGCGVSVGRAERPTDLFGLGDAWLTAAGVSWVQSGSTQGSLIDASRSSRASVQ